MLDQFQVSKKAKQKSDPRGGAGHGNSKRDAQRTEGDRASLADIWEGCIL